MVAEGRARLREALVDAAERTVSRDGLGALHARSLAAEVGCAVGAIYTVFPDLDALILAVNLRTLERFEAAVARSGAASDAGPADAKIELVRLAVTYLDYATAETPRWRALFQHRMSAGRAPPPEYVDEQARLFRLIEGPLAELRPDLAETERALLARTLFSATHGVVSLGLDEKLEALSPSAIRAQLETLIGAIARGLPGLPA